MPQSEWHHLTTTDPYEWQRAFESESVADPVAAAHQHRLAGWFFDAMKCGFLRGYRHGKIGNPYHVASMQFDEILEGKPERSIVAMDGNGNPWLGV